MEVGFWRDERDPQDSRPDPTQLVHPPWARAAASAVADTQQRAVHTTAAHDSCSVATAACSIGAARPSVVRAGAAAADSGSRDDAGGVGVGGGRAASVSAAAAPAGGGCEVGDWRSMLDFLRSGFLHSYELGYRCALHSSHHLIYARVLLHQVHLCSV
jgi:hypothetical protein